MIGDGETERLVLRPLEMADAAAIQELFPHWEIVRYMLKRVPWPYPADGAADYLRNVALPEMERGEGWHWGLRLKAEPRADQDRLIGVVSLMPGEDANRGFWLGMPWQGQGLMSEACVWANDYWFDVLGFPVLRVWKAIANEASRRISERQGMRMVKLGEREFVSGTLPAEMWEITAGEWREWKGRYGLEASYSSETS